MDVHELHEVYGELRRCGTLVTFKDYEDLPYNMGYKPKRVWVFDDKPGTVEIVIVRKWYQRIFKYWRSRMQRAIEREIKERKVVGLYVVLKIR